MCTCIAQFSIVLMNHSGSSEVLTVPEYSHHIIRGMVASCSAELPFARGLLGSPWSSSTDILGGCVFVTVKKYYPYIKLQDGSDIVI